MRKIVLGSLFMMALAVHATVIIDDDFSSYTDGDLLFQGPWSAQGGWTVSGGEVTAGTDFQRLVLVDNPINSLAVGQTVQVTIDHRVGGSAASNSGYFEFGLKNNGNNWTQEGFTGGEAEYNNYLDGTYKVWADRNGTANNDAALAVAPVYAGFMLQSADDDDGTGTYSFDGTSDELRIVWSITKTDVQDVFDVNVVFSNLTTGAGIAPANAGSISVTSADIYDDNELFLMIKALGPNGAGKDFSIDRVAVEVIPEPATLGMLVASASGIVAIRRLFLV